MHDVVISFDTTGSMRPCINSVRDNVERFANNLFRSLPDLRISIIWHGDYCDAPNFIGYNPFVTTQSEVTRQISGAKMTGGGDADECYEHVMNHVLTMDGWRKDAKKTFILIGDCNPHNPNYRYGKYLVNVDWKSLTTELASKGITTYPVQCLDNGGDNFYRTIAKVHNTPHLRLHQLSDIEQLLTAITYAQQSQELVQTYGQELETSGKLNRNLAQLINSLLGDKTFTRAETATALEAVNPYRFQILHVPTRTDIQEFVTRNGAEFKRGRGFYQLVKPETIQERKEVILRNRDGDMFTGAYARELIGLPFGERGTIKPYQIPDGYIAFVQSTSMNRKLDAHTQFLYETI